MTSRTILYLNKSDLVHLGGDRPSIYVEAVSRALRLHAMGKVVQPLKPYLRWRGEEGHIADRIIAMPAYVGGDDPIAGLKWVGSKHDNPSRYGLERASAVIILNDPETHYPIAVMEGSLISGMRTAAATALATGHLARKDFHHLTCIGCGPIASMQLHALLELFSSISDVHLFDLDPDRAASLAATLQQRFPSLEYDIAATAERAVRNGEVVITCTVADKPYVPFDWIQAGAFISNVSIMDLHKEVFLRADKVVVDDWDQCNREKKVINQLVIEGSFSRDKLHAELGEILIGRRPARQSDDEVILLNPMGMAIEDIACAQALYQQAIARGVGTKLSLN